jgi:AraC-like DNA-binding protein
MRAAMDRATRFHALANPLVPIRCEIAGPSVAWLFPPRHALMPGELDEALYRVLIEMQMTIHQTLARDVMGPWCVPDFVGVTWPEPPGALAWAATFGSCPSFGAQRCELRYPAAWLDRAPQMANAVAAAQTSRECARLLESLKGADSVAERVCRELTRVPGQFPDLEALASTFCVTSRTLRRHLQAEGTSYAELLARVRRALAEDYLRATRMNVDDIAAALAFSDGRSFRQAFVRWTGHSPSDFRRTAARHA